MALHSIGENEDLLRAMHRNKGHQQRTFNFSMDVNKKSIRAFHISNMKINIPK